MGYQNVAVEVVVDVAFGQLEQLVEEDLALEAA